MGSDEGNVNMIPASVRSSRNMEFKGKKGVRRTCGHPEKGGVNFVIGVGHVGPSLHDDTEKQAKNLVFQAQRNTRSLLAIGTGMRVNG